MAITPNMNLLLPDVGVTFGPLWATELNAALSLIDSHDHVVGQGVPVPTAGIALNADLPFNGFNATTLRSTRFNNQASPLALVTDLTCLYVSGNNLYYNNGAGQQVQITQGAGLNAASVGGFGGDYGTSTASAFYTSATSTFSFWQAPNQSAIMDMGPMVLHNTDQITFGVTLQAPVGLSTSYQLTLPTGLPASRKIMTVDASGNVGDVLDADGTTIQVSGNSLIVAAGGISNTQIAPSTITVDKFAAMPVSTSAAALSGMLRTNSCVSFTTTSTSGVSITNLNGSIVTSGRPVYIGFNSDLTGSESYFYLSNGSGAISSGFRITFIIDSSVINVYAHSLIANSTLGQLPSSGIFLILPLAAGTHTIDSQMSITTAAGTPSCGVFNTILVAYEI